MKIITDPKLLGPIPVLVAGEYPENFYTKENYCRPEKWMGVLRGENGERLNKNIRSKIYPKENKSHIAKTPLHAIRYAISTYTKPGEVVLDPFMGSGTTGVEAMIQGRRAIGVEYEFAKEVTEPTLAHFGESGSDYYLYEGDAEFALDNVADATCHLVNFSNPYPDGGDHTVGIKKKSDGTFDHISSEYQKEGSAGLMKSNNEYWKKMEAIQRKACLKLVPGGHAVFVIKDMMRNKQPWELHRFLADLMPDFMEHVGTFALDHYPRSLFMNTYETAHGTRPPLEQVCAVFRRKN